MTASGARRSSTHGACTTPADGNPAGTVTRLTPKFSSDYPKTLTAHDIGLKDLLDAAYFTGRGLDITLFAVSIDPLQGMGMELSATIAARVPEIAAIVIDELPAPGC